MVIQEVVFREKVLKPRVDPATFRDLIINEQTSGELWLLVRYIRRRLRKNHDLLIAITGDEGVGKSTLAVRLSYWIDKNFTLENNVSFYPNPNKIVDDYSKLKKKSVFLLDEAVRVALKYDWAGKLQQSLLKMYTTERWQCKCTIMCIPRIWDLAPYFRDHRTKIWIHVDRRGHASIYQKDNDKDNRDDPWHNEEAKKAKKYLHYKSSGIVSNGKRDNAERKLKNFVADFFYPELPPPIWERYEELKIESRKRSAEEVDDIGINSNIKKRNNAIIALISRLPKGVYNIKELAKITGLGNNLMSMFVRKSKFLEMEQKAKLDKQIIDERLNGG